jgi:hypothetical protein
MYSSTKTLKVSKNVTSLKKEICPEIKSHILYNLKKSHKRLDELITDLDKLTLEHQIKEIFSCEL